MKTWFTSDPHFGHKNILKYCPRPFSNLEEMEKGLIQNYNALVQLEDKVYFLGDIFFTNTTKAKEIIKQLNGYKILVKGNHDRPCEKMIDIGFNEAYKQLAIHIGGKKVLLCHFPYRPKLSDISESVQDEFRKTVQKQKQTGMDSSGELDNLIANYLASGLLTQEQADRLTSYDMRFLDLRYENDGHTPLLCGHVHEKWQRKDNMINVGVDVWDMKPVSEDTIKELIK